MIEIRELSFKYKGGANYSLKDINLIVKKGECILLCGRSGCGKSTLLKLMNGIIPEFYDGDISGSVMVNGMNTFTTPIYKLSKNVGSVFQNPKTQFYTTNTTDEIAFGLENYGIEREVINKRIEEVEKELHLENLMNKNIFNLSGGEKQKIAIASIYALNPEIFILDEPSSSLDIKSMKELSLTIKKLKSLGKTIIIAEHRLWYLKDIADRAIYLEDGKIIREYSMDEIENLSEDERTRTGLRHSDYKAIERFDDFETSNKGTLLELKNLIFKRNTKIILSIEDLKFCYGNIIGIVGENGIGKSTLAKIICGLYKENKGKIELLTTYRYNRANTMRGYFKSSNKNERLDSWNNSLFYALNYANDRKGKDFRDIFKDATLQIVKDDKVENELTVKYEATIENPYFVDSQGKRFLMYFDGSVLKNSIREHQHSDVSFWHNFDSERYEIYLQTDENIDTKEKYTIQECDIQNKYFTHKTQKFITKNSGKVIVEYNPLMNIEIPLDKLEPVREDYHTMADSNFGIGIDVVEKGFLNSLKRLFK